MTPIYIALGILAIWLSILTFLLLKATRHYKKLSTRTKAESIDLILDRLLDQTDLHKKDIKSIHESVKELHEAKHSYFQKFGYVKFNPFGDRVGGEQSFVIALLDNRGNGLVKTFMYTRDGVRVYVKPVKDGSSNEYELSQEEKEAIKKAS